MQLVNPKTKATIKVDNVADDLLDRLVASTGIPKVTLASKVFHWLAEQPDGLQRAVLGLYGPWTPQVTKMVLEEMARPLNGSAESRSGSKSARDKPSRGSRRPGSAQPADQKPAA